MIHLLLAAALALAPNPIAAPEHKDHAKHHEGMKHDGPCCPEGKPMDCCKDKPMPCCEKKKADAPAAEGHGAHEHDH